MKKSFTRVLLAAAMFCVSSGASVYDFEADGIYYNITSEADKTVEVTIGNNMYTGDVSIPATVENGGTAYTVTAIDDYAFMDCSSLESVTLGQGIKAIGKFAFSGCSSLVEITCRVALPPACGIRCFDDIDGCTLNLPEGAEEAYKADDAWKEFFYEYFMSEGINYGFLTSSQGNIATVVYGGEYTGDITIPATVEIGGLHTPLQR